MAIGPTKSIHSVFGCVEHSANRAPATMVSLRTDKTRPTVPGFKARMGPSRSRGHARIGVSTPTVASSKTPRTGRVDAVATGAIILHPHHRVACYSVFRPGRRRSEQWANLLSGRRSSVGEKSQELGGELRPGGLAG
jgi:hypothetical protein